VIYVLQCHGEGHEVDKADGYHIAVAIRKFGHFLGHFEDINSTTWLILLIGVVSFTNINSPPSIITAISKQTCKHSEAAGSVSWFAKGSDRRSTKNGSNR